MMQFKMCLFLQREFNMLVIVQMEKCDIELSHVLMKLLLPRL
jgi:hypothetical protein